MIDTQIESVPKFPFTAMVFLVIGVLLTLASVSNQEVGWAIGSIPCWVIAAMAFVARQRVFSATITADGLDFRDTGMFVPFATIDAMTFRGKVDAGGKYLPQQTPIHVSHDAGAFTIPADIDMPSNELFGILSSRFQAREVFELNALLTEFADEQTSTFGDEKVHRFTARETVKSQAGGSPTINAVASGMLIGSVFWFAAAGFHETAWIGGGVFLVVVGILLFFVGAAKSRSPTAYVKGWRNSGLIISPVGLALVQGTLKGRMRWDELKDVKFNLGHRNFQISAGTPQEGIILSVEGSSLVIVDLYNQPIATIHTRILQFWRGHEPDEAVPQ